LGIDLRPKCARITKWGSPQQFDWLQIRYAGQVSEQTLYVWRKHFAGLAPADVKRLEALELDNAKLKRLLAERDLEVELMCEVNRKKW
jgi:putative transposase